MEKIYEWWSYHKKQLIILGVIIIGVIVLGIIGYVSFHGKVNTKKKSKTVEVVINDEKTEKGTEEVIDNMVSVDIKGAVNNPGVYSIKENSRISEVLAVAGGVRNDADLSVINLSKKVYDEMVIIIYTKNEVKNFSQVKKEEKVKQEKCVDVKENVTNNACVSPSPTTAGNVESTSKKISLNNASKEELMTLSGIGESKALLIIEYRTNVGLFKNIDELKNVSGIGDSLFEKIKENITV